MSDSPKSDSPKSGSSKPDSPDGGWYIVKRAESIPCEIVESAALPAEDEIVKRWGPFASPPEAIARRVGLIRAGKCQPQ